MTSALWAALLKPILWPVMKTTGLVIARCGLLLVQRLPDSKIKRLLTRRL